ncbi:unnamed protein product [Rangifer tarandus platyrhynchus]|uniref:Uncharacterized protein n=2 Tax=Rangifer tarandus platyrhynchus TaxID=3082113 RepID=A0ABN8ZT50_RANTA|nr:unnamed protein product [Rangifer tarandus platyrhynchus]CAI9710438.1 unnamed protein product [Rangifer tarandus platyrhynchus]
MPLTQRCAEPPATALAQLKLPLPARARGLCWGPSGPRAEAGGGESEPPPPRKFRKGPADAPPGATARGAKTKCRLHPGFQRARGTAGGVGQAGQGHRRQGRLTATRQRSVQCSRDPWVPPRRARRPPVAPPLPSLVPTLLRNWEGQR